MGIIDPHSRSNPKLKPAGFLIEKSQLIGWTLNAEKAGARISLPLRQFSLILIAVFLAGCSTLPLESSKVPHPSSRVKSAVKRQYREAVGVIHIHTTYSDGSLPIERIVKIANDQDLDYLIFTDHDNLQGLRDGKQGWHGSTLVLVSYELSTTAGHYLALRVPKEVPRLQSAAWAIEAVSAQGGLGFIAHPFWRRKPWKEPGVRGMTGLEIYSAVEDVAEEPFLLLGFWTIFAGSEFSLVRWLDRPHENLAYWDKLLSEGKPVVGIGSPDAHGLRRFGLRLGPYSTMFKMVRNHLLVEKTTPEGLYDALERGHLFVAHDLVADSRGFRFVAIEGDVFRGVMGDEVTWSKGLRLYAYLPSPGVIQLFKDGQVTHTVQGQLSWFEVGGPGVYRVEAMRKGKPWIYSNPIYVVE